ncbi:hypothetical protein KUTeg_019346 [Tegillarca granosa]|uniref:Uncharacterized protein n=1 Tax=Tegillarca granosa TaxID=220873 RepID=A0ABQ9EHD4_TEGGR|nr:hypothetical protein KUTeg_019346 [Tegillarca granosa]
MYMSSFLTNFLGLGYLMVIVSYLMSWYYIMVIVWVLYYLVNSFFNPLPWSVCTNDWNSEHCIEDIVLKATGNDRNSTFSNSSIYSYNSNYTLHWNATVPLNESLFTSNTTAMNKTMEEKLTTAAKEFWQLKVLQISSGLDDVGGIQWHLVVALLVAWILVFICLMKGVKTVGKVMEQSLTLINKGKL